MTKSIAVLNWLGWVLVVTGASILVAACLLV